VSLVKEEGAKLTNIPTPLVLN